MHEDLLGYLLGALEPDEMQRVSAWLRDNPEAQAELAEIERSLKPLEDGFEVVDPPSQDLLERTLAGIPEGLPPQSAAEEAIQASSVEKSMNFAGVDLARDVESRSGSWSWMDSVGSLVSVAVLLALLLPMIAEGRFESRKVVCQNQLGEIGNALMQYANRDFQGRLPHVAASGPEAFAGVYAMRLADAGLLPESSKRWCPSAESPLPRSLPRSLPLSQHNEPELVSFVSELPAISELSSLSIDELKHVQRFAGGHYAYTLGVVGAQGYSSPRFEARASFAVMADAPIGGAFGASGQRTLKYSHGGEGINVLYEDGAVRFIRAEAFDSMPDHPLVNHEGQREAGVNIDDASLSPSWRPPFSDVLQR